MQGQITFDNEIIVDNFAGGGGASTGIELATGRPVDIAINHDPDAILMHKTNHPFTEHYQESVWDIDPEGICRGRKVGIAWFSPDCKHFSRAKGGKPVDNNIRGLVWVSIRWALLVKPRVIMIENVPEIQTWCPLGADNRPIKERSGETFKGFIKILSTGLPKDHPAFIECCNALSIDINSPYADELSRGLGYKVEYRELKACDYGAPTIRKRFFLIARCDGNPIVWPKPTHAPADSLEVKAGKLKPYKSAAECIDFTLPCPSIFERKKPLAINTQRRIARGLDKFVIKAQKPYIVPIGYGERKGQAPRVLDIDKPLSTIVSSCKQYLCYPFLSSMKFNNEPVSADNPLQTITAVNSHSVIFPYLTEVNHSGQMRGQNLLEPLHTITAKHGYAYIAPSLIQYHSETVKGEVRGQSLNEPVLTVDGSNRYGLQIPYLSKFYGGVVGADVQNPMPTVTAIDHNGLTLPFLTQYYGGADHANTVCNPLQTITVQPRHFLCTNYLTILRNNMDCRSLNEPLNTITTSGAHFANTKVYIKKYEKGCNLGYWSEVRKILNEYTDWDLADNEILIFNINGIECFISDIGLRMLQPIELYQAQGFPADYIIERDYTGKVYPKTKQVARCGNAVPPAFAKALVQANLPEMCKGVEICTMNELNEMIAV